jgi:hypothetical protein
MAYRVLYRDFLSGGKGEGKRPERGRDGSGEGWGEPFFGSEQPLGVQPGSEGLWSEVYGVSEGIRTPSPQSHSLESESEDIDK